MKMFDNFTDRKNSVKLDQYGDTQKYFCISYEKTEIFLST
jgi:hypothetical protein